MKRLILFTRQLVYLLKGGLPLLDSFQQLNEVFPHKPFKKAAGDIVRGLKSGYSLNHLLQGHPKLFPHFYVRMVEVGEYGDSLLPALETLVDYYGEKERIKSRLSRITFYPVLLLLVAMGSGLFALWHVIPTFSRLYSSLNIQVPLATARVFKVSAAITPMTILAFLIVVFIIVVVAVIAYKRAQWNVLAKVPLSSTLTCYWFCRVTGMVTKAGHTLNEALDLASIVSPRGPAPQAKRLTREGHSLYDALAGSPNVLKSFVAQGERVGELPDALDRAAMYYRQQVEDNLDDFQRVLEPAAVLVVGAVVATMLLALMLPMMQLTQGF